MAEAFAKMENVEAFSAGSNPSGKINPKAIESMKEMNYDLSTHHPKTLEEVKTNAPFDAVITMGCGDACPWMPATKFVDWNIPDPKQMNTENFREVRDLIREKVKELIGQLKN